MRKEITVNNMSQIITPWSIEDKPGFVDIQEEEAEEESLVNNSSRCFTLISFKQIALIWNWLYPLFFFKITAYVVSSNISLLDMQFCIVNTWKCDKAICMVNVERSAHFEYSVINALNIH